ncbi:hypothetical protein [Halpernia frigidisoli]|uniref:DUF5723 domain-containing protein n=1 Tax=Halpernia frigidisoli TaxID=1125876 RepID=A0A1I3DJP2_9FLAO|nr:hypothetical protein [Halpernia frigidisoli]SFH86711.1 hypothetical protein SAMN05443292_0499 [Halpernia frigidisoli]
MSFNKSLFFILFSLSASGQENLTFSNDLFSGINSAPFSPTQPFFNENSWDVNLFSESINVENDYAYISNKSFLSLRNGSIQTADIRNNVRGSNTAGVLDFYNKDLGNFYFNSDILGPSFSLKQNIKGKVFQLGIYSRLRTQGSALKVDNYFRFGNQGLQDPDFYDLKPFDMKVVNWGEIGFNMATELFPYAAQKWVVGANFKYEIGLDAVDVKSFDVVKLKQTFVEENGAQKQTISAENYNLETNFATNYNFDSRRYELKQNGKGFGLDLGISMLDKDENADNYNFKASFSVLDLGKINFKGQKNVFKGNNFVIVNNPDLDNSEFISPQQYLEFLSNLVYGDKNVSLQGTDFTVGLPTSLHLNLSKNITGNQYLNFDIIQRSPVFENSLKRSNVFTSSYTVQKNFVGYGGSVSLYEYKKLQFGGYLRLGPLILGSSNFFPLIFKQKKLNSGDFFIGLKIYPFWDNEFKRHRRADCNCE